MAESVVSFAGQTIGKLLIDEAKFLWGVEGKIQDLQIELKQIQGFLKDADTRREHDQAVGEWIAQLQDIAYDAEDVLERYILRVATKKEQNIVKSYACFVAKCTCAQVHVVGTEIERLKSSISNLRTRMEGHGIQYVQQGERKHARASTPKRTYAHFEEDLVGREDDIKELVKELLKDGKQRRVISIWGMGGLGKTTLAKKVYAHDQVKNNFDGLAWACVSQEYQVRNILVGILFKLIPDQRDGVMKMTDDELFETLYKFQQEKRCIVVLDDIWTKQAWDDLRAAFPVENTRSKLLITTRNREVAEYIDPQGFLYEPRYLSNQESWELLMKRAFPETKATIDNMKTVGYDLLKKCGGLPLAVIMLGGLLAVNKWETVQRNISLHFGDKSDVAQVLALSYDDLPWHLKPCFLYLGSFPIDKPIPAKMVLPMWIAEGFVLPNTYDGEGEISMEDVAKQYLMELVKRGMVEVKFSLSGEIKTCWLHDLMRDLCIVKARQERFLRIIDIQQERKTEDCSSSIEVEVELPYKTRRLSLDIRVGAEGSTIPRVEKIGGTLVHLRTLIFFNSGKSLIGTWEQFQPIFINCKRLRVVKLEGFRNMRGNLPESVGELVHLRYLSLAGSMLNGLPQSMGNLVCMEYLDLQGLEFWKIIVPNVLWKMRRLRHLHLPSLFAVSGQKKLQLDSLQDLRTLRNFNPEQCDVNDLGKLTNLQKLTAPLLRGADKLAIIPQLANFTFKHLQSSSFEFWAPSFTEGELSELSSYGHSCKLFIKGGIEKLPEHKNLPQQLTKLVLLDSQLEEDPMPTLEKLQHLVVLLMVNAFVGKEMACSAGGFLQLKNLLLQGLPNLEALRVAKGAMPHLSRLEIGYCSKLKKSAHTAVLEMFSHPGSIVKWEEETEESWEDLGGSPGAEKMKAKSMRRELGFELGEILGEITVGGGGEDETFDEWAM
ncbi:putative disease resistance protein At1g50180 [Rhodamnia argentea]|uniref:Disease resistance protein At1g50180 n=1 Tax=Rhodamnia argentea TaxID=178133 RepID=A0ABM3H4U9_9MYRT|nr:putative disease resistance protein At1g50180 [Rhodamnia argentea]